MAGMAAGRGIGGRTRHPVDGCADGAAWLAPGHSISTRATREKLATLDALSMQGVLSKAKDAQIGVQEYEDAIANEYSGDGEAVRRYKSAQERKDWRESDMLFLDMLSRNSARYRRLLDAENTARAFSAWLCGAALGRNHTYRWLDPPEIESCVGGTFESRIEDNGTRRGFKALTVDPELWFDGRKIRMRVPIDRSMRGSIRCVQYTVMPRHMEEKDERIGDQKSARYAMEAEIRVPDGTPIPAGTDFAVLRNAGIGREEAKALGARYEIRWSDG